MKLRLLLSISKKLPVNTPFTIYFDATDEAKTVTFTYDILGSIELYKDYGQFYWQLQGKNWPLPVFELEATIRWDQPFPMDQYNIWGAWPLSGCYRKNQ